MTYTDVCEDRHTLMVMRGKASETFISMAL